MKSILSKLPGIFGAILLIAFLVSWVWFVWNVCDLLRMQAENDAQQAKNDLLRAENELMEARLGRR